MYNGIDDLMKLNVESNEIEKLNEIINKIRTKISKKTIKYKEITILPEFKSHIEHIKLFDTSKTIYAKRINNIIKEVRRKSNKSIALTQIKLNINFFLGK